MFDEGQGRRHRDARHLRPRFIHSIYFRDPNGYVIELTAKRPNHEQAMDPAKNAARQKLDAWQAKKARKAS